MSASPASTVLPPDQVLVAALRKVVQDGFRAGEVDQLSINHVRAAAEAKLGLRRGCLKGDDRWREESKEIIRAEFEAHEKHRDNGKGETGEEEPHSLSPPAREVDAAAEPRKAGKTQAKGITSANEWNPSKKRKRADRDEVMQAPAESSTGSSLSPLNESELEEAPIEPETGNSSDAEVVGRGRRARGKDNGLSVDIPRARGRMADKNIDDGPMDAVTATTKAADADEAGSESEMSVVIDEEPATKETKKRKARTASGAKPKPKKGASKEPPSGDSQGLGTDEAEIKRLQSWLVKCGVRKMWHKELSRCDTPKAKIKHLKGLLDEVGMTGRFSLKKAERIKEERELQAEVEAVQATAKRWGDGDEEEAPGPRKRRLAKGLRDLDFLGDDSGEES